MYTLHIQVLGESNKLHRQKKIVTYKIHAILEAIMDDEGVNW